MPGDTHKTGSNRLWLGAYLGFAGAACMLGALRLWWSWPDAAWQSNFWFLPDIDRLLNGDLGHVTWFTFGDQWALNGYRWYEYLSASLFGFDARVENIAYYLVMFGISAVIGYRIFNRMPVERGWPSRVAVFLVPLVFASMSGAGSRGMELGTFTGVLLVVWLFTLIDSTIRLRLFLILTLAGAPVAIFVFLGGYASGPVLALAAVSALQAWRPTLEAAQRHRLNLLTIVFAGSTLIYFLLLRVLSPGAGGSELSGFLTTFANDPLFPLRYLFWGTSGGTFTYQTAELLGESGLWPTAAVCLIVIALTGVSLFFSFRRNRNEITVPLLLVLYPCGIALTLLATRSTDVTALLSTWYSVHFKVALAGAIWLAIIALGDKLPAWSPRRLGIALLLVGVASSIVVANGLQFQRQPAERTYFLNVAKAALSPQDLVEDASGRTGLQASLPESLEAIRVLEEHGLSVYRDPMTTWAKVYGREPEFLTSGSYFEDGWSGQEFSVIVLDPSCETLEVGFSEPIDSGKDISLTARTSFGDRYVDVSLTTASNLIFHPSGPQQTIEFEFSDTFVPSDLQINGDERELSALVDIECVR